MEKNVEDFLDHAMMMVASKFTVKEILEWLGKFCKENSKDSNNSKRKSYERDAIRIMYANLYIEN